MRTWLPALLIGLATGYAALFLREMGWLIAGCVLVILPVVYVRQHRLADVGWLYLGAGLSPILLLGQTFLQMVTDPAIQVESDTWVFFGLAVVMAGVGIGVIMATARRQRGAG